MTTNTTPVGLIHRALDTLDAAGMTHDVDDHETYAYMPSEAKHAAATLYLAGFRDNAQTIRESLDHPIVGYVVAVDGDRSDATWHSLTGAEAEASKYRTHPDDPSVVILNVYGSPDA